MYMLMMAAATRVATASLDFIYMIVHACGDKHIKSRMRTHAGAQQQHGHEHERHAEVQQRRARVPRVAAEQRKQRARQRAAGHCRLGQNGGLLDGQPQDDLRCRQQARRLPGWSGNAL